MQEKYNRTIMKGKTESILKIHKEERKKRTKKLKTKTSGYIEKTKLNEMLKQIKEKRKKEYFLIMSNEMKTVYEVLK